MATQNTMMVPCMVTMALYASGATTPTPTMGSPGQASWLRSTNARRPPITAMNRPVIMYCLAMTL